MKTLLPHTMFFGIENIHTAFDEVDFKKTILYNAVIKALLILKNYILVPMFFSVF